ncbi:MAG: response regulator [Proteobacteria bacterium]|nr:response regulator [Pseudomonadota bacterium]
MSEILIVDDDPEIRENLEEILQGADYRTSSVATAQDGINRAISIKYDLILLDFMMPGMNGIEALSEFKRVSPKSKVIMITAFATIENAVEAIKKGASEYISKPFKIPDLLMLIKQVLEELRFEYGIKKLEMEETLSSLSNSIRREIIRMIWEHKKMRMMGITRELGIEDHTKVLFHLKTLKESGLLQQDDNKAYQLTKEGEKIKECLTILDNFLSDA